MPQVGLGHFVQRAMPVRPQSSPANRMSCRLVSAYCDWVVRVKLSEYVERLVFSGSPCWVVPAAATPNPTPVTGLEDTNGMMVRWRLAGFFSASPGGGGFLSPSSSPSQVGRSFVTVPAPRSDGRATSIRPAAPEPLPAAAVPVEPGRATSGTDDCSSLAAACAVPSSVAVAADAPSNRVTSQPALLMLSPAAAALRPVPGRAQTRGWGSAAVTAALAMRAGPTRSAASTARPWKSATPQSTAENIPRSMSRPKRTGAMERPTSRPEDRKSTRLNSSHVEISYA